MTGFDGLSVLVLPLSIIGIVSFVFALLGHALGIRFGFAVSRKVNPELLGGLLLIAIGLKILISNLITN
jgi:putative Mn2+ efflux pump MntP